MGAALYEHNQTAYESAAAMLAETGRAAVIHPTGTGKSFLGFQLCADHPKDHVLWLSPSEYIFRTQEENWRRAGGVLTDSVRFLTYAKLMRMEEADMDGLRPRYIVLDEFHRCGAQLWGQGVKRLLARYPKAKLLGLTATNIRYLDNQRDMARELFDGNVASEITLGEAVVRGILKPPKYVLSVYSYQKDIARLSEKICRIRSRAVRDEAEAYHSHTTYPNRIAFRDRLKDIYCKKVEKYSDYAFACGTEAGKWLFPGKEFVRMNNAIPAGQFAYDSRIRSTVRKEMGMENGIVAGTVGRFHSSKNPYGILEIVKRVHSMNPDVKFLWVGDGEMRDDIENEIRKNDMSSYMILTGCTTDVSRLMQAMDVFILPSIF